MEKGYLLAGVLFCVSGIVWINAGNIPIAMMNISAGCMWFVVSRRGE